MSRVRTTRRLAAVGALIGLIAMVVVAVLLLLSSWLFTVLAIVATAVVVTAVVRAVVQTGHHRMTWTIVGVVAAVVLVVSLVGIAIEHPWGAIALVGLGAITGALAVYAQRGYVRVADAPVVQGPRHDTGSRRSVLFLNPKSGGGKVVTFDLVAEAQRRGVETVVLGRDDDLTALAEAAVADGVEVLGMAGGDGSQADVAAVAVAHGLPFVCIPAGTRNHFALDLNLDRDDPRRALDAFVEGVERRVDHGLVNDRFFVNNVSLGVYPHVVEDPSYREGRVKAAVTLIPELVDPERDQISLTFDAPDGTHYDTAQVLLVSNNPYRAFSGPDGAGRRVSLDGGQLGVLVIAASDPAALAAAARRRTLGGRIEDIDGLDQWTTTSLRVGSDDPKILTGIDGEAVELDAPLEMRIVPRGLRVIVPVGTAEPPAPVAGILSIDAVSALLDIAGGVAAGPFGDDS